MIKDENFQQRLRAAIKEGAAARRDLIACAASLTTDELIKLPVDTLRVLTPRDFMAALENRSAAGNPMSLSKQATPRLPARRNPLVGLIGAILALTLLGPFPEHLVRSFKQNGDGSRPVSTATWPACPGLAPTIDGCVYTVGGGGELTLANAAEQLDIALDEFRYINTHILGPASSPLPRGTLLVVWRGQHILEGQSQ